MTAPIGGDAYTLIAIECQEASGSLANTGQLGTFAGLSRSGTATYNQSSLGGLKAVNLFTPSFSFAGNYFNGTASFPASNKWTISLLNKPTNTGGFTWGSVTTGSTWFSNSTNALTVNNFNAGHYGISASVTLSDASNPIFQINAANGPLSTDYVLMWMTVDSVAGVITLGYHRTDGISAPTFGYSVTQSFTPGVTVNWGNSIVWMGDSGVGVQVGSDGDFSHARIENTVRDAAYFSNLINIYQIGHDPTPTLTRIQPGSGYSGQASINAVGTNFTSDSKIVFDGIILDTNFVSSTVLQFTVPNHALGSVGISVATPGLATASLSNAFIVIEKPTYPSNASNVTKRDPVRDTLRRWLNPAFQGVNWEGLLDALADADRKVITNIITATDQLHYSTASGDYLSQWGSDYYYPRAVDLGMPDDDYRRLLETITNKKLTVQSFLEVINIFYGDIATRAHGVSLPGPFLLNDGDDLKLLFDGGRYVHVFFKQADFVNIALATPAEVAAVINRYLEQYGFNDFAISYYDGATQQDLLQIYSASLGLGGFVQVLGGTAENGLQLPTSLNVPFSVPTNWTMAKYPTASQPNYLRMSMSTSIDYSILNIGDYVNIVGTEFNVANRGSFTIKTVADSYIEIDNINGVAETVAQPNVAANFNDVLFYRPHKTTINDVQSPAFAAQVTPTVTKVVLPAISKNVLRDLTNAAYLPTENTFDIVSIASTATGNNIGTISTITTSSNHGLVTNDTVFLNDIFVGALNGLEKITYVSPTSFSIVKSFLTPLNTLSMLPFVGSTLYSVGNSIVQNGYRWLVTTTGTTPASPAALPIVAGAYAVPGSTIVVLFMGAYVTPTVEPLTQTTITTPGPYVFDDVNGLGLTSVTTTITQSISINSNYKSITVTDSTSFPNSEGYLVLGFGQTYQSPPIHYIATPSSTTILLDPNTQIKSNVPSGATVTLLVSNAPYVPDNTVVPTGIAYVTGDHLSRVYAENTINFIKGGGLQIETEVQYPSSVGLANGNSALTNTDKVNDKIYVWGDDDLVNWKKAHDDNS
jgi:hypothetical protein